MTSRVRPPTFEDAWRFDSLLAAFRRARRAKRGKGEEPVFYRDLETNLLRLSDELRNLEYRPRPYRYFRLWNKKERMVSEAAFRDRVVHHSLVAAIEPTFEEVFIRHSYACRKGKGTHLALREASRMARAFPYFLKLDIRRYFDHVSHDVLLDLLSRKVADRDLLWLCEVFLAHTDAPAASGERRGLPIGNLTSQFWANVYLDPLDHLVRDDLGCGAYLRYMDDMVLFDRRKERLWLLAAEVGSFCREVLRLDLKDEVTRVAPVSEGIPWLGFRVYPGTRRLDAAGRRRFVKKLRASWKTAVKAYPGGSTEQDTERDRAASLCGHLCAGSTHGFRRSVVARLDDTTPIDAVFS